MKVIGLFERILGVTSADKTSPNASCFLFWRRSYNCHFISFSTNFLRISSIMMNLSKLCFIRLWGLTCGWKGHLENREVGKVRMKLVRMKIYSSSQSWEIQLKQENDYWSWKIFNWVGKFTIELESFQLTWKIVIGIRMFSIEMENFRWGWNVFNWVGKTDWSRNSPTSAQTFLLQWNSLTQWDFSIFEKNFPTELGTLFFQLQFLTFL